MRRECAVADSVGQGAARVLLRLAIGAVALSAEPSHISAGQSKLTTEQYYDRVRLAISKPMGVFLPSSMEECNKLQQDWSAYASLRMKVHSDCIYENNGKKPDRSGDAEECSYYACEDYHGPLEASNDVAECRAAVTKKLEAKRKEEDERRQEEQRRQRRAAEERDAETRTDAASSLSAPKSSDRERRDEDASARDRADQLRQQRQEEEARRERDRRELEFAKTMSKLQQQALAARTAEREAARDEALEAMREASLQFQTDLAQYTKQLESVVASVGIASGLVERSVLPAGGSADATVSLDAFDLSSLSATPVASAEPPSSGLHVEIRDAVDSIASRGVTAMGTVLDEFGGDLGRASAQVVVQAQELSQNWQRVASIADLSRFGRDAISGTVTITDRLNAADDLSAIGVDAFAFAFPLAAPALELSIDALQTGRNEVLGRLDAVFAAAASGDTSAAMATTDFETVGLRIAERMCPYDACARAAAAAAWSKWAIDNGYEAIGRLLGR